MPVTDVFKQPLMDVEMPEVKDEMVMLNVEYFLDTEEEDYHGNTANNT